MPLEIPPTNLKSWTKFASSYYYYPSASKDDNNHIHVGVENASADPLTIKFVSVKVNGTSTNLAIGNPLNKFKFKPDAATWPDNADTKKRYTDALRTAGLIA
jgi:hypothetical protein